MINDPGILSRWALILVIGLGIFTIRLSFIHSSSEQRDIPSHIEQILTLVPVAILAAIVSPDLIVFDGTAYRPDTILGALGTPRVVAGVVAAGIAWRTRSITLTVAGGMGVLWILRLTVG